MSPGPYTAEEMVRDITSWLRATPQQQEHAFINLLCGCAAVAHEDQHPVVIARLRRIRAKRDGSLT